MITDEIHISRIEIFSKRKHTYALYSDDVFLAEVVEDTIVHFSVSKGSRFSKDKFSSLLEYNNLVKCMNQSYEYLRRRPHLKNELYRKLKNKQFDNKIIGQAINELQKRNYLNDDEYIGMFIRDSIRQMKSGPLLLKKKLLEKGAQQEDVNRILDDLFSTEKQIEIVTKLIQKKYPVLPEDKNEKQKLIRYFLNRGFSWSIIENVVRQHPLD